MGEASEDKVLGKLAQRAVLNVFNKAFSGGELDEVVAAFQGGRRIEVSDSMASSDYVTQLDEVRPLQGACGDSARRIRPPWPPRSSSSSEGLHLNKKLNKDMQAGHSRYRV
jgi:hypothetical protein